ncbi:unnamed protein product [Mucor hiemalis]
MKSLKQLSLIEKDEANVKIDFIFCNTFVTGINNVLVCEDKPTENELIKDLKNKNASGKIAILLEINSSLFKCIRTLNINFKSVQQRTVVKNIEIIKTILQIIHEDNLNFLAPNDLLVYESDSDSSTDSNISTSSNSWKAAEREERMKERVNECIRLLNEQHQRQYVSTDWEINAFSSND